MTQPNLKKNYIYNMIYQIVAIITPFITAPYAARVLGADGIGIYSYTFSIANFFILFAALGVLTYGRRAIARVRDDKYEMSKTFYEIEGMVCITTLITIFLWAFVILFYKEYSVYFLILSLQIIAVLFDLAWFFAGLELYNIIVWKDSIVKIVGVILLFLFVKNKNDVWIYALIISLAVLFGKMSQWMYLKKLLVKVPFRELDIFKHFKESLVYFIPTISISVYTVLDKTVLGIITSDNFQNGYYEEATKILNLCKATSFTPILSTMSSRFEYLFNQKNAENDIEEKKYNTMDVVLFVSMATVFGLISITKIFVPWFFGKGFDEVVLLINVLAPVILIISISSCLSCVYFIPAGLQKKASLYVIIGAFVNLFLNIILIPKYKALGACIATIIAETIITILYVVNSRKTFSVRNIIKLSYKKLISAICMFLSINYINKLYVISKLNPFLIICFDIIVGAIVYLIILFVLKDSSCNILITQVKIFLNKMKIIKENEMFNKIVNIINKIFCKEVFLYYMFLYVLFKNFFVNYGQKITYLTVAYAFVVYVYDIIKHKGLIKFDGWIFCYGMMIAAIISVLVNKRLTIDNISLGSIVFINFLILSNVFYEKDNEHIHKVLHNISTYFIIGTFVWGIIGIMLAIFNIKFNFFGIDFGMLSGNRLQLCRPSINPTGHLALCGLGTSLFNLFFKKEKYKIFDNDKFLFLNILIQLFIIYFSGSRETFLALFVGIVWILFVKTFYNKYKKIGMATICVIVVIFIIAIVVLTITGNSKIYHLRTLLERIDIIAMGLFILSQTNIFFGSSYGGLVEDWERFENMAKQKVFQWTDYFEKVEFSIHGIRTHNSFFHILFATGIFGFVFFILYLLNVIKNIIQLLFGINKNNINDINFVTICGFFIVICFMIGLASDSIYTTMTEFPNIFLLMFSSAIVQYRRNILL